jgi:hypothetical protein
MKSWKRFLILYFLYATKIFTLIGKLNSVMIVSGNKMSKKHLPSKICAVCSRTFEWRKKWAKVF